MKAKDEGDRISDKTPNGYGVTLDERAVSVTYHGVCECCRNSNNHPPNQSKQEIFPFPSYQVAYEATIQLGDIQTEKSPQHEEHAVAHQKSQFLTPPAWDHNPQQAKQVLKELPVNLYPLLPRLFVIAETGSARPPPHLDLLRRSFLFGDRIVDSLGKCCEEGEIDGAGDARPVFEVEGGET